MKFDRVLSILVSLLSAERVTAVLLAKRFGVSVRTIYRDVQSLEEAGVPVISRQGQGGGIDILEGFSLSRHLLKPEELERLNAALKGLLRVLPDAHTESSAAKIAQLGYGNRSGHETQTRAAAGSRAGVDAAGRDNQHSEPAADYFYFDMNPWTALELAATPLQKLYDYCKRTMIVTIDYRDNKGSASRRDVEPMTLVYRGSSWYLFAWCRTRQDYRMFRIAAIEKLTPSGARFQRKAGTYETVVKSREDNETRTPVLIRFDAEAAHVVGDSEHSTVRERYGDGSLLAEIRLREDDVMPYCGSWGSRIEVLEPLRVREALIADTRARLAKYQNISKQT